MATIVSSTVVDDARQRDGRRQVRERHVDSLGVEYIFGYLADANFDAAAACMSRAAQVLADAVAAEIAANIAAVLADGSLAVTSTLYSTGAQNFAALRTAYQTATRTQAIMAGDFLSSLTSAQLQTAFGMTAGQVTTLRSSKLTPAASAAATIRAATGA